MRRAPFLASLPLFALALLCAPVARAGEEGGEPPPPKKPASDSKAVALFEKAVAWQGRPTNLGGNLVDLRVDRIEFKLFSDNEVEGKFKFRYTAPDKVWFEVWTQAWWRQYWSNGEAHFWKTGATGCEFLNPEVEGDKEKITLVTEALRIARLIVLQNHREGADFTFLEDSKPKGKPDAPDCFLVKRSPRSGDRKELMYFFLDKEDHHPVCIGVMEFLNVQGVFFIHLSRFKAFQGVRLPTRIEIYAEKEGEGFVKFLFADVIENVDEGIRVKVNSGVDPEIYDYQKD